MKKSTKKPALAAANTPSDNNLPSGSGPASRGNSDFRTIAEVLDTRLPFGLQRRTAQSVLGPQSAVSLAELRTDVHGEHAKGGSLFLCAQCEQPVFVAQRPAEPDVPRNGDAAYFKHFSAEDAPPCSWRTQNLSSIGAVQYSGQQEGLDHLTLKNALAECLKHDHRFTDVRVEKRVAGKDGNWRVPDVAAVVGGKVLALDLQLAALPISTILERASFYEENDIHHIVLTDAVDLVRLTQQAFCDMHLTMGGRIFAVDDSSIAASLSSGRFQLKELSIVPRLVPGRPVHNIWESRLVGIDAILMDPFQRRKEGERQYSQALMTAANASFGPQRQAIRRAAAKNMSSAAVFEHWNHIARAIGGLNEDSAIPQGVGAVLAFLTQVEICCNVAPDQRASAQLELQQRLKTLLDSRHALHWAPLVVQVFKALPGIEPAICPANSARLTALLTQTHTVKPTLRWYAGMIGVLHPFLAFRLLVKAPKFLPSLRLPASRA
ncbi:MAG: hypothetical protein K0R85_109 [Devosia sp.]|jgi:hypothetical protein|nr:hypothetical protein [Devosia sp.]